MTADDITKTMQSLVDLEYHERRIGREVRLSDKDGQYWTWKLMSTDVLNLKYNQRRGR